MKKCTKCNIEKQLSFFQKQSCKADGLRYHCKSCRAIKAANHYKKNKEKILAQNYNYSKARLKVDINFKLAKNIRCRLNKALKINQKVGSAIENLGCSIEELKAYLESKLQPGMTWDNYGLSGWHIDHIKPPSLFDLTDEKQLKDACHFSNLQPMWAKDNLSKSNNLI